MNRSHAAAFRPTLEQMLGTMKSGLRINEDMLELICCPASHQRLRLAQPAELSQINEAIAAGKLAAISGEAIHQPLVQLLIREDGQVGYPVVDGIARLIVDDGIQLPGDDLPAPPDHSSDGDPHDIGPQGAGSNGSAVS